MPFQKGHTKFGGRRKGSQNHQGKVRQSHRLVFADEFQAALVQEFSPLEVMHAIMLLRVAKADYDGALSAAEKAAPYCHARLNSAEVKVQHSLSGRTDAEVAAEIELLREKLAIARQPPLIEGSAETPLAQSAEAESTVLSPYLRSPNNT
jgi:hypothetical protein